MDPSAGWCGPASSGLRSEADDTDGDGVRDALDACDDVDGVPGGLAMGCPDLLRRVTASYAAGVVSGTVRFTGVQVPSTACAGEPRRVELWVRPPGTGSEPVLLKHGTYEPVDGTYSIGGDLPVGATYRVHVRGGLDPEAGYCVGVDSGNRTVGEADTDGDEVADDVDECDAVSGPTDDPDFPGCPTLERDVSGSYEDGLVSGAVTSGSPGCLGTVELQAVETAPDGTQSPAVSLSTGMDGTYVWEPTLGPGSQVQVVAPRVLASDRRGVCARAVTGLVEVPGDADTDGDSVSDDVDACDGVPGPVDQPQFPGCPALARSVTASYAGGTITGQVSVLGPNPGSGWYVSADRGAGLQRARRGAGAGRPDHDHDGDRLLLDRAGGRPGGGLDVLRDHRPLPPRGRRGLWCGGVGDEPGPDGASTRPGGDCARAGQVWRRCSRGSS